MKSDSSFKAHAKRAIAASERYINNGHAWKVFAVIPVGIILLVVTGLAGRIISSAVAQDTGNGGAIIVNGLPHTQAQGVCLAHGRLPRALCAQDRG